MNAKEVSAIWEDRHTWIWPFTDDQRATLRDNPGNRDDLIAVASVGFDIDGPKCVVELPDDLSWMELSDGEPVDIRFGWMTRDELESLDEFQGF